MFSTLNKKNKEGVREESLKISKSKKSSQANAQKGGCHDGPPQNRMRPRPVTSWFLEGAVTGSQRRVLVRFWAALGSEQQSPRRGRAPEEKKIELVLRLDN